LEALHDLFEDRYIPEPNSGCFLWTGSVLVRGGYGNLLHQGKNHRAHRLAWTLHNGPITAEECVLHRCDTPSCVNPNHLFLGDRTINAKDKRRKGRAPSGEKHWSYKHGKHVGKWARRTKVLARYNGSDDHLL
jgi:hypothetical protein